MSFNEIVEAFIRDCSEHSMNALVTFAQNNSLTDHEIAFLARRMAESGTVMNLREPYKYTDIPSTGGPTSLSTILCPLFLVLLGYRVPKLAVPGRPAGGIDIMAQIPDYRISFGRNEINDILDECGYAHFLATDMFVPLDGKLYAYRKRIGAINIPELAIASLLSKKIAVGLKRIGLEIRVAPHGNFGGSWDNAKNNARKFIKVATLLDIKSVCFLTNALEPYQPYIGRGESLIALEHILDDTYNEWLKKHAMMCFAMARSTTGLDVAYDALSSGKVKQIFKHHLLSQGSSYDRFLDKVHDIRTTPHEIIISDKEGFVVVDLPLLRDILVKLQNSATPSYLSFPDPAGITLYKNMGDYVNKGEEIASVRYISSLKGCVVAEIKRTLFIKDNPGLSGHYEEVTNA